MRIWQENRWFLTCICLFFLALAVIGGYFFLQPEWTAALRRQAQQESQARFRNDRAPGDVVKAFYDWYLQFEGNPVSSAAYQESDFLTAELKQHVSEQVGAGNLGADPFLCAQDKPDTLSVGLVQTGEQQAQVEASLNFSGMIRPLNITLVKQNNEWRLHEIGCGLAYDQTPTTTQNTVIYFSNPSQEPTGNIECGLVYGVERTIDGVTLEDKLTSALTELFQGPTAQEQSQGFTSFFSAATADALLDIRVEDRIAYVNLRDIRDLIPNASSSCGSQQLLAEITETLQHTRQIDQVILAIEGNPTTFYEWLQLGCDVSNNFCRQDDFVTTERE